MDFVNIHSRTLRTDAYVRATGQQRATWLNLLTYCATQENGGKIHRAAGWTDLQWLVAVGVHKVDVDESCDLWQFTAEGDCVVTFYPSFQEETVKAAREGGIEGNRRRWAKARRNAKNTPPTSPSDSVSASGGDSGGDSVSASGGESVKEWNGMERNEKEESDHSLASIESSSSQPVTSPIAGPDSESEVGVYAEWPTREEWMAAADMEGLPRELALREWNNQERKPPAERWAKTDRSRLRYHAAFVMDCARQRGEFQSQKKSRPPAMVVSTGAAASDAGAMAAMAAMAQDGARASEYPPGLKEAVEG